MDSSSPRGDDKWRAISFEDWGQHRPEVALPPGSGIGWRSAGGGDGRLAHQASEVAGTGEDVGEDGSLGAVVLAVPGGAFHTPSPLVGVAAFGITQSPDTQLPSGRIDLEITGQADIAIG